MAILVIAEHDNSQIKSGTLNTVTAAQKLGSDVHLLVAGAGCAAAADAAKQIAGVSKVLLADAAALAHPLADLDSHYGFAVPMLAGDHVTDDAGTGFVHTAPGHGADDYQVWLAHGHREIPDTVDLLIVDTAPGGVEFVAVPRFVEPGSTVAPGSLVAPMPGMVIRVAAALGDTVTAGQPLLVLEAMKMEHTIHAPRRGTVKAFRYGVGDQVVDGVDLVDFEEAA